MKIMLIFLINDYGGDILIFVLMLHRASLAGNVEIIELLLSQVSDKTICFFYKQKIFL